VNRARPDPISAPDSQQFDAKLSKTPRIQTAAPKCTGISERREFTSLSEHSAADRTKASRIRTGVDRNRAEAKPQHSSAPQRGSKTRTSPKNRIIRQNSTELARRAHLAGVDARPPPIALGSPPRRCSSAAGPAEIPRPLRNYSPLPCLWGAPSSSS